MTVNAQTFSHILLLTTSKFVLNEMMVFIIARIRNNSLINNLQFFVYNVTTTLKDCSTLTSKPLKLFLMFLIGEVNSLCYPLLIELTFFEMSFHHQRVPSYPFLSFSFVLKPINAYEAQCH